MASSIKAKVIRVTRQDVCGTVVPGATGSVISDGFASVKATADIDAGVDFYTKNAWGDAIIDDMDCSRLKRYNLEFDFWDISPAAVELMCGYRLITDATTPTANMIGNAFGTTPGSCSTGFSLELWTKVAGAGCGSGTTFKWFHWLFPMVRYGMVTDFTYELAAMQLTMTASTLGNPNYVNGPYAQWVSVGPNEHLLYQMTNTDPPAASDEAYTTMSVSGGSAVAA